MKCKYIFSGFPDSAEKSPVRVGMATSDNQTAIVTLKKAAVNECCAGQRKAVLLAGAAFGRLLLFFYFAFSFWPPGHSTKKGLLTFSALNLSSTSLRIRSS